MAVLAAAVGACSPSTPGRRVDRVVLVTIDTLRADHTGAFGYPLPTTPFLDTLAAGGVQFRRAYAQSATTAPSHTSMLTGLFPIQHGVLNNGQALDVRYPVVAEALSGAGVSTAAFVSAGALYDTVGLARGFDRYDQPDDKAYDQYRPAHETTAAALQWVREADPERPFFLWVHYYDPHLPLRPPAETLDAVTPPTPDLDAAWSRYLVDQEGADLGDDGKMAKDILHYDGEIRFVDEQLQRLFEGMEAAGFGERTLWVVTSDHGQGLGNHEWFGHHVNVYDEQLHVPQIWYLPGGLEPRVIDDRIVQHVDIAPTILEMFAVPAAESPVPVQGRSLVPLLDGDRTVVPHRYAFAARRQKLDQEVSELDERLQTLEERASATRPSRRGPTRRAERIDARIDQVEERMQELLANEKLEPGEKYALQDLRSKYIWFSDGPDELYDLVADPNETVNLVGTGLPDEALLRDLLLEIVESLRTSAGAAITDEATLERLRSLGYVQ